MRANNRVSLTICEWAIYLGVHDDLLNAGHCVVASLVPLKLTGTRPVYGPAIARLRMVLRANRHR
jgi:hypothetical protein